MTNTTPQFSGVIPPVVTPRTADGGLDLAGLEAVVEHLVSGGVHGLFPLGSSGETPYLTDRERGEVLGAVVSATSGRVPLLVGANEQTTPRVIEEALRVQRAGADAVVVTSPYYALSDHHEVLRHFRAVRAAVDVPVFAYDVPVRTHYKLEPALLAELAAEGTIAGVKDSSGNDIAFRQLRLLTRDLEGFALFTGHEVVCDQAMLGGADGLVPGLANVDPAGYRRLYDAGLAGDWAAARAEQDRLIDLFTIVTTPDAGRVSGGAGGLGAFKTALVELGVIGSNRMSAPMESLNASESGRIRSILAGAGLV
ncbi:dihydrodipicolinate synthase family protein [Zhihengliuella salsuginis]|uniref:Dihydrodipicolinate synthase family protein n=1 Tax=Zhihengliuella salsuginis TaxID=578222 RepID=A0ABQ3GIB2_9MICC|nr:dihydrodipicolinate synthase family protein [Zhihengliuella salsuginis]GHD04454.1 dihydrodipicolinate synthase family protein [Zhihengliuella salsuginis]